MSNYYEILGLELTATQPEIKTAIDEKYAYWNSLASHHDPEIVERASREKWQLEEIRAVLGSNAKRKKYDNGLDENVGGLAEKTRSKNATKSKPTTLEPITQPHSVERLDAWICPKCRQINAIGQKFCCKCGGQIGEECSQCKHLSQIINAFCPHCGSNKAQTKAKIKEHEFQIALELREKKVNQLLDTIQSHHNEIAKIARLSKTIPWLGYDNESNYLHKMVWEGFSSCGMIFIKFFISYLFSFPIILSSGGDFFMFGGFIVIMFMPVTNLLMGYLYRAVKVKKISREMIQERINNISQIEQEIRQIQMQS